MAAGTATAAAAASRDATQCSATQTANLYGSIVVPEGATCVLAGITVSGSIDVQPGGELDVQGGQVNGSIQIESGGTATHIACGTGILVAGGVLCAESSVLKGSLRCDGAYCELNQTQMYGSATMATGTTRLAAIDAEIHGSVNCTGCLAADVFSSTVYGSITSSGQLDGGLICDATIKGSVRFTGNVQFFDTCDGNTIGGSLVVTNDTAAADGYSTIAIVGNTIGGSLDVSNDTGSLLLLGNQARGSIRCRNDNPPPTGSDNFASSIDPACGPIGGSGL